MAQRTYYVAAGGLDTNEGLSITTPFQSLQKVNSLVLLPGDTILFRRGDTFQGTLLIRYSGTATKPIHVAAYGKGNKPILRGSTTLTNWRPVGPAVWETTCLACGKAITGVYQNGQPLLLGRYPNRNDPNRGCLTVQSHVGKTQLTSKEELTTNWVGAEVVLRPTYWILDRASVTHQSGQTLELDNSSSYELTDGWGYFLQNHPATLDQPGEWYYEPSSRSLQLYSLSNPNSQLLTATAYDESLRLEQVSHVTIQNLVLSQARRSNVYGREVSNLSLINCEITQAGEDGLVLKGTGESIHIAQCAITNCNNNGVFIDAYRNVVFRQSSVQKIGLVPGRGKSGDGQYSGFQSFTISNMLIENNVLDSIGYNGINVQQNALIRQNRITNFCMTKSDGGGIYLWNGNQLPADSIFIQANIIRNGVGTTGGLSDNSVEGANGIFLDDCVQQVDITDNTIANCRGLGFYLHAVNNVRLLRNTCFNNSVSQLILYNYQNRCLPRNNLIAHNIFMAKPANQAVAGYISATDDLVRYGHYDHNYYARPFNDVSTIRMVYNNDVVADLNLSEWQSKFSQDLSSHSSPITYNEYKVKSRSSFNRINNILGDKTGGWETWSRYNNGQTSWNSSNPLAANRLTMFFSNSSGRTDSYMLAYKAIKAVDNAKTYLIQFDASGPVEKKIVVFIRQQQAPYQDLTQRYEFMVGPARKSFEFALTTLASEPKALLAFQLAEDNQPVWLDNIRLQEAIIEPINPDEWIRLVDNPTTRDSLVLLNTPCRDIKNRYYSRQVLLKPFSSIILLRDTLPPVDASLLMHVAQTALQPGGITSVSLTIQASSPSVERPVSSIQWRCQLPSGIELVKSDGFLDQNRTLTGTIQRLSTDTTIVFWIQTVHVDRYQLSAQLTTATYADPDSTPGSGTDDGEDDQASIYIVVNDSVPVDTISTELVTSLTSMPLPAVDDLIYPNPTANEFILMATEDISTLQVFDRLGVERLTYHSILRNQCIPFGQALPEAFYLVRIHYKTGVQRTVKLIKAARYPY